MAYVTIPSTIIEAGDPVTQELFTQVKDNLDDLNTRVLALEAGSAVTYPSLSFDIIGPFEQAVPLLGATYRRIDFNMTVLAGRVSVITAGSSGTTQIDILYKRGAGAFTSIFTTKPSLSSAAGNFSTSTNGVLDSPVSLLAGDFLRLDVLTTQAGDPSTLIGFIQYEKA